MRGGEHGGPTYAHWLHLLAVQQLARKCYPIEEGAAQAAEGEVEKGGYHCKKGEGGRKAEGACVLAVLLPAAWPLCVSK